jgi:hypothetical protein
VRLLGGLVVWVSTLYCAPAKRTGNGRGPEGSGLYPELAVLGIQEGTSPALASEVGRQVALLPSYEIARQELARRGIDLDGKVVYRIGTFVGEAALTYRRRLLEQFRTGQLPAGTQLAGKRLAAFVDGGRTKVRRVTRRQKGKGKTKTQRRRYQTSWREPKVLILYEIDEQGRKVADSQPIIDGTFAGPDEVMELLAMYLHYLGAAKAEVVTLGGDGAPWIWERWDWVIGRAGLDRRRVYLTLDWYHAVHHISLALEHVLTGPERKRVYKKLRKWLRAGRWVEVVGELARMAMGKSLDEDHEVWTPIHYLNRHGEQKHLDYARYRRRGLPLGSGAVESAIRRVINLRMKGNSISWKEENAEAMLVLRGLVLTGRWDEEFARIWTSLASDRRREWTFKSPDMPAQLKVGIPIKPPEPQPPPASMSYDAAA